MPGTSTRLSQEPIQENRSVVSIEETAGTISQNNPSKSLPHAEYLDSRSNPSGRNY